MRMLRSPWAALALVIVSGLAALAFTTRHRWLPSKLATEDGPVLASEERTTLTLSPQARQNLGLVSKPVKLQNYWRTLQAPGVIVDRPGISDRGVTAPAVGVVAKIHAFPGETVRPGDCLVTLRLNSEYLQNTQAELFKATRETQLVKEQRDRLAPSVKSGALPEGRLIEIDQQLQRLSTATLAHRQDLLTRGLTPAQIDAITQGKFISEIEVVAPPQADGKKLVSSAARDGAALAYEVQELKAELGQQVQAGQLLCVLANHQALYIEGHSFQREARFLEQAARYGWEVRAEFADDDDETKSWPPLEQTLLIRHLANTLDAESRTFDFYIPLANQSRHYEQAGKTFLVWRFRPGQHVRLHVPIEELKDVVVLPAAAVVREGPEAFVFYQDGDLFERLPVHVLHEDRLHVVLKPDENLKPGLLYLAQSAAASLHRVLKAQNASGGLPPGAHFHADGSLHIPGQ